VRITQFFPRQAIFALGTNRARWARKVGDDAWTWKNVKQRFKKIESYHVEIPEEHKKYINPKPEGESSFLVETQKKTNPFQTMGQMGHYMSAMLINGRKA
jgi:hypothetical protein